MSFLQNNHLHARLNLSILFLIVIPGLWNVQFYTVMIFVDQINSEFIPF